ncbi:MAG: 4-carboxymuconolactone decarboxylase [Bauldia sp.]
MADERLKLGEKTRRRVLGDAHVDRSLANATAFDKPFIDFITGGVWASVWGRPNLTPRERSLITIALLAGLGHHEELAIHIRATRNTGASEEDVREALLHVAAYAGAPAGNSAIVLARRVYGEMKAAAPEAPNKKAPKRMAKGKKP